MKTQGIFLILYLQKTAATSNKFKAQHFINYLGADSKADKWFDKLPQEEEGDWTSLETANVMLYLQTSVC